MESRSGAVAEDVLPLLSIADAGSVLVQVGDAWRPLAVVIADMGDVHADRVVDARTRGVNRSAALGAARHDQIHHLGNDVPSDLGIGTDQHGRILPAA